MKCFHLYVYVYVCVPHQDRLEDMKCFHSYISVHLNLSLITFKKKIKKILQIYVPIL